MQADLRLRYMAGDLTSDPAYRAKLHPPSELYCANGAVQMMLNSERGFSVPLPGSPAASRQADAQAPTGEHAYRSMSASGLRWPCNARMVERHSGGWTQTGCEPCLPVSTGQSGRTRGIPERSRTLSILMLEGSLIEVIERDRRGGNGRTSRPLQSVQTLAPR